MRSLRQTQTTLVEFVNRLSRNTLGKHIVVLLSVDHCPQKSSIIALQVQLMLLLYQPQSHTASSRYHKNYANLLTQSTVQQALQPRRTRSFSGSAKKNGNRMRQVAGTIGFNVDTPTKPGRASTSVESHRLIFLSPVLVHAPCDDIGQHCQLIEPCHLRLRNSEAVSIIDRGYGTFIAILGRQRPHDRRILSRVLSEQTVRLTRTAPPPPPPPQQHQRQQQQHIAARKFTLLSSQNVHQNSFVPLVSCCCNTVRTGSSEDSGCCVTAGVETGASTTHRVRRLRKCLDQEKRKT